MPEQDGTTSTEGQAQKTTTGEPAAGTGTGTGDDAASLRSRLSGQDAKITELTKARTEAEARAAAADKRLAEYEAGKVGADEALKAQLKVESDRANAAERKAQIAEIKATYPEAYVELGDAVADMPAEKLASLEARLSGRQDSGEPPTPRGQNGARTTVVPGSREDKRTSADILAELKTQPVPWH